MPSYSDEAQARVAEEVEAAPPDAVWPMFMADYGTMRAQLRAGCG